MYVHLWGPHAWIFLHSISYQRDEKSIDKYKLKRFIELLSDYLPCPGCRNHLKQNYINTPNIKFEDAINDLELFGNYIVELHNLVNSSVAQGHQKYVKFTYEQSKNLHLKDNAFHNAIIFFSTIIVNYSDYIYIKTDKIIEIKNMYFEDKKKCIDLIENYKIKYPRKNKEIEILNRMFIRKNFIINYLEADLEKRSIMRNEINDLIKYNQKDKDTNDPLDEKQSNKNKIILNNLNNQLKLMDRLSEIEIENINEVIQNEFEKGINIFLTEKSIIENIVSFTELFGYLLPYNNERIAFFKILGKKEYHLTSFIDTEKDLIMDWLVPFINSLNKELNKPFENLSTIEDKQKYFANLKNLWGNDFGNISIKDSLTSVADSKDLILINKELSEKLNKANYRIIQLESELASLKK